jgi:hypothetical protein
MTWPPDNDHGISGHIYEILDYYLLLKDHFKIGILLCEDISWETFKDIIVNKYNVTDIEVEQIKHCTVFNSRPKNVRGNNILFVDGGLKRSFQAVGVRLFFKNILSFRCSKEDTHHDLPYKNITLLQDNRVYDDGDNDIAINYKKKIKFDAYHEVDSTSTNTALIYMTKNCRLLADGELIEVATTYDFDKYMVLTSTPETYRDRFTKHNLQFPDMPVKNIFEQFDTYIYTPTSSVLRPDTGCFDCSPRFIAECAHYGKQVIYHNIDDAYLNIDTGLKYRRYDIENDFNSIILKPEDQLIDILREKL